MLLNAWPVCKSETDLDIIKMGEQAALSKTFSENDFDVNYC